MSLIWKKPFSNADELVDLLLSAGDESHTPLDEIHVGVCGDGDRCGELRGNIAVLESEELSDKSVVYDITIH